VRAVRADVDWDPRDASPLFCWLALLVGIWGFFQAGGQPWGR
jgi:hypothetical protein